MFPIPEMSKNQFLEARINVEELDNAMQSFSKEEISKASETWKATNPTMQPIG